MTPQNMKQKTSLKLNYQHLFEITQYKMQYPIYKELCASVLLLFSNVVYNKRFSKGKCILQAIYVHPKMYKLNLSFGSTKEVELNF